MYDGFVSYTNNLHAGKSGVVIGMIWTEVVVTHIKRRGWPKSVPSLTNTSFPNYDPVLPLPLYLSRYVPIFSVNFSLSFVHILICTLSLATGENSTLILLSSFLADVFLSSFDSSYLCPKTTRHINTVYVAVLQQPVAVLHCCNIWSSVRLSILNVHAAY